ncbi:hypothetical protein [Pseudomonas sp. PDM19]|uniref:hypothetical protein n=1 Tax=Pseudomonas sp. PDM19 TaxID=2769272 RepID=UPI00177CE2EE|nr:hypothetical protein [Pseudomonas sp. PDM19]MBD9629785.1 hypothetical protein [Pseudomonas sp. PDM19]
MASWDAKELREAVLKLYDGEARNIASEAAGSLSDRLWFVEFHYFECKDLLERQLPQVSSEEEVFCRLFNVHDEHGEEFEIIRRQSQAHLYACIQSLHCVADTLGSLLNATLSLGLKGAFYSHNVLEKLVAEGMVQIYQPFSALIHHPDFVYLNALVNRSKHTSVVAIPYAVDYVADGRHGMQFSAFRQKGTPHDKRWALEFVASETDRQSRLVVIIGNALNAELKRRLKYRSIS